MEICPPEPLSEGELERMREKQKKDAIISRRLLEMLVHGLYVFLMLITSCSHRDVSAFYMRRHLESKFWSGSFDQVVHLASHVDQ